jgi:hypothetical protein
MTTTLLSKSSTSIERQESIAKLTKAYQADQQVKYLHLQAEIEVLLQQLQTVKTNRH